MKNSEVAYPSDEFLDSIKLEVFKDPMDIITEYDRIWTEVMSGQ